MSHQALIIDIYAFRNSVHGFYKLRDKIHRDVTPILLLAQPNNYLSCRRIYLSYERNLLASLLDARLIDTDLIGPNEA